MTQHKAAALRGRGVFGPARLSPERCDTGISSQQLTEGLLTKRGSDYAQITGDGRAVRPLTGSLCQEIIGNSLNSNFGSECCGAAVKQLIFSSTAAASNAMLYLLQLAAQQWAIKPSKGGTYLYFTAEFHTCPEGKREKERKTAVPLEAEH